MTKQLKKGFLAILLFVMSICCVLSVNSFATVKADANEDLAEALTYFKTVDADDLLDSAHWDAYNKLYASYMNLIELGQGNNLTTEQKTAANVVLNAYADARDAYSKVLSLRKFLEGTLTYAAAFEKSEEVNGAYNALDAAEKAYVDLYAAEYLGHFAELASRIAGLELAIEDVEKAIADIDYYDGAAWVIDPTFAGQADSILLDSKKSMDNVAKELKDITEPDYAYVDNYAAYTDAIAQYKTQVAKYEAIEKAAKELEVEIAETGKFYVLEYYDKKITKIEDAFADLAALNFAGHNDLQKAVAEETKTFLNNARKDWNKIDDVINNDVEKLIAAIPAVIRLIPEHLDFIAAAEKGFDTLPKDVKVAAEEEYKADGVVEIVEGYEKMLVARAEYDRLLKSLDYFKDTLTDYEAAKKADSVEAKDVVAFNNMAVEYLRTGDKALTEDQKVTLHAMDIDGETWKVLFDKYYEEIVAAKANANEFRKLVAAIVYEISPEFVTAVENAYAKYETLDEVYEVPFAQDAKAALDALKAQYLADTEALRIWEEKVMALPVPVASANFADVDALNVEYNAFSNAIKTVVTVAVYDKYIEAVDYMAEIREAAKVLEIAIKEVGRPKLADNFGALEKYATMYITMVDARKALDTLDATAFAALVDAKLQERYAEVLVEFKQVYLEMVITVLPEVTDFAERHYVLAVSLMMIDGKMVIDLENGNPVAVPEGEEVKVPVDGIGNYDKLVAALKEMNERIDVIKTWMANTKEAIKAEYVELDTEKAYRIYDTEKLFALRNEYYNDFSKAEKDYKPVDGYNGAAYGELVALPGASTSTYSHYLTQRISWAKESAAKLTETMDALNKNDLDDLSELEAGLVLCKDVYEAYDDTMKSWVDAKVYADFMVKYNRLNFANYFEAAVKALDEEVKNDVYTADGAIMIDVLKTIYIGALEELQNLSKVKTAYKTLVEVIEPAYEKANVISLKGEIEKIYAVIDNLTGATDFGAFVTEINGKVEGIEKALSEEIAKLVAADADFAKALNDAIEAAKKDLTATKEAFAKQLEEEVKVAITTAKEAAMGYVKELKDTEVKANTDAIAKEVADRIAAIEALKTALEKADADLADEIADAIADAQGALEAAEDALEAAIAAEKAAREEADAQLKAAIEAAEKARKEADAAAKAELEDAVAKLNKTITIITVILSVVSVACAGALVYIFLKKRA